MERKIRIFVLFVLLLLTSFYTVSIEDYQSIIDFSITLKELSDALEKDTYDIINKDKLIILTGTVALINPQKSYFFFINSDDVIKKDAFLLRLKKSKDGLSRYLVDSFSEELKAEILGYTEDVGKDKKLLDKVIKELKKILRAENIYHPERFKGITLKKELKDLALRDLNKEERTFVNRLLMEAFYTKEIQKISVNIELVYAIWIGYDEVKSYKTIITFSGPESFKIFNRKDSKNVSPEMISMNSSILVAVNVKEPVFQPDGRKAWLLDGIYIREIK